MPGRTRRSRHSTSSAPRSSRSVAVVGYRRRPDGRVGRAGLEPATSRAAAHLRSRRRRGADAPTSHSAGQRTRDVHPVAGEVPADEVRPERARRIHRGAGDRTPPQPGQDDVPTKPSAPKIPRLGAPSPGRCAQAPRPGTAVLIKSEACEGSTARSTAWSSSPRTVSRSIASRSRTVNAVTIASAS